MKVWVCWTTAPKVGPRNHPCGMAHKALVDAGHDPEVVKGHGWNKLPEFMNPGRREIKELTGRLDLPVLILDDGSWIQGSREIIDWAQAHPAPQA